MSATLALIAELRAQGLSANKIAVALNQRAVWTERRQPWRPQSVCHYLRRLRDREDEDEEVLDWSAFPMPTYPRPARLTEAEVLCGSAFYDTDSWGRLAIPVPNMKRTR